MGFFDKISFPDKLSTLACIMFYIFWKLLFQRLILAIKNTFWASYDASPPQIHPVVISGQNVPKSSIILLIKLLYLPFFPDWEVLWVILLYDGGCLSIFSQQLIWRSSGGAWQSHLYCYLTLIKWVHHIAPQSPENPKDHSWLDKILSVQLVEQWRTSDIW